MPGTRVFCRRAATARIRDLRQTGCKKPPRLRPRPKRNNSLCQTPGRMYKSLPWPYGRRCDGDFDMERILKPISGIAVVVVCGLFVLCPSTASTAERFELREEAVDARVRGVT